MQSMYGLNLAEEDDKYIATAEAGTATSDLLVSGSTVLELIPLSPLARIPRWIPGLSALRRAEKGREAVDASRVMPWIDAKKRIVSLSTIFATAV